MADRHAYATMYLTHKLDAAREAVTNVAETLRDAAARVEQYRDRFDTVRDDGQCLPEEVLSWVVNHVASNVFGNCRLDILVTHAHQIAQARCEVEHATALDD